MESLRGAEGRWRTERERKTWLGGDGDKDGFADGGEVANRNLGTVGAGNHFAEVQVAEGSAS